MRRYIALLAATAPLHAQSVVEWSTRQDGGLSLSDYAHSLAIANDGSVLMAGRGYNQTSGSPPPPPTTDAMLTKLGADGVVQWSRRHNGPLSGDERLERVVVANDGVIWSGGYAGGFTAGSYQITSLLLRHDASGNLLSSRGFGDPTGPNNIRSLAVAPDGTVHGCGHDGASGGDAVVWRFDAAGGVVWTARIPEVLAGAYDTAYELAFGPSGEVYACGLLGTVPGGTSTDSSAFVARIDAGVVSWTRVVPGAPGAASVFYSLAANAQGETCAVGAIHTSTSATNGAAVIHDASGNLRVRSDFVGAQGDYARGVAVDSLGRFFVGADGFFGSTGRDFALELLAATGPLWRVVVDGGGGGDDSLRRVCVLSTGDLVAAGTGPSTPGGGNDALVFGLDAAGATRFSNKLATSGSEQVFGLAAGPSGTLVVGGWLDTQGVSNSTDQWCAKLARTSRAFCTGESAATCPCGNGSTPGAQSGCANSLGAGARLVDQGASSLALDTLALRGSGMPNSSSLYFQGSGAGSGAPFGDGLRCATGTTIRLATRVNSAGASTYPYAGEPSISVRGAIVAPGVRSYQVWYRNSAAFCTPSTFNLSNGLQVLWTP
jgi:hypothetical protein